MFSAGGVLESGAGAALKSSAGEGLLSPSGLVIKVPSSVTSAEECFLLPELLLVKLVARGRVLGRALVRLAR